MRVLPAVALCCGAGGVVVAGEPFTIVDAINQAVTSNPGVGEAAANRRATEAELHQSQGVLLPQVRLDASHGIDRFSQNDITPPPQGDDRLLHTTDTSLTIRQTLFDGLASINEIWRQAARVNAAAYRVHERTELIALDAAEAYIDVIRFTRLISIASDNLAAHRRLEANVEARFKGGRSGEGDLQQVHERVAAAQAQLADFRQQLDQARATYRKVVGLEPFNLRAPGRLGGMPASRDDSLAVALKFNPTIRAAGADAKAAKYAFHETGAAFLPNVALEAKAQRGNNINEVFGRQSDESVKAVLSWDIFNGGQDSWKRAAAAERYTEATMAHARLQRDAFESLDKAWSARTLTADRVAALVRQVAFDRKAIDAYTKEYELGQRSLIDLLNSENQLYGALVSLESTRAVAVFADYQLLAAMGQLLTYLKSPAPVDAAPLEHIPLGIFPTKIAPILVTLPKSGPEPLNVAAPPPAVTAPHPFFLFGPMQYAAEPEGAVNVIDRRWPGAPLASPGFWGWPRVDGQGVAGSPH
jgi:adhesin transport system outer membrane protein